MKSLLYFLLLIGVHSCQKNHLAVKSSLFREALKSAFQEYKSIPFVKNDIFSEFTQDDILQYREQGINIWRKDELFMLGIREFISIYQVELKNSILEINYFHYRKDQEPQPESIHIRVEE